jgi:hypothetical protein
VNQTLKSSIQVVQQAEMPQSIRPIQSLDDSRRKQLPIWELMLQMLRIGLETSNKTILSVMLTITVQLFPIMLHA